MIHLAHYTSVINQYSHVTAHYLRIIFLPLKFSVQQHREPGVNTFMYSVLLSLVPLIPPHLFCIDRQQHLCRHFLCPLFWPIQSGNIWCSTQILWLEDFRILAATVLLYVGFIVCLRVVFTVNLIFAVTIPVKPIFSVPNAFRCTVRITFSWIAVDPSDLADIQYLSSFSREVFCSQSWLQRRSLQEFKFSHAVMSKVWPGCVDNLFSIACTINSASIRCYFKVSFRIWKFIEIHTLSIIFAKPCLMTDTRVILALPSLRSLLLVPMSMLSFSPNGWSRSWASEDLVWPFTPRLLTNTPQASWMTCAMHDMWFVNAGHTILEASKVNCNMGIME